MNVLAVVGQFPILLVIGVLIIIGCACGGAAAILDYKVSNLVPKRRQFALLEREKDIAGGLGWPWQRWVAFRVLFLFVGLGIGFFSGILELLIVGPIAGVVGFRFALSGRAASRRLKMERAFLVQLRNLRDRMSVSNQSLDTALQELGRNPGSELEYVFEPLRRGGAVVDNIVEMGRRSRSPIVEYAAGVLLWARSRSLDALIEAIDDILLPVGEAQLAVVEESMVTLTQQRAVTFAMCALMGFMFAVVIRVDIFRQYYESVSGQIVLAVVILMFAGLVGILGIIVRITTWTRWDLGKLAQQQERLGG
ncbi:MAG: type II secretion system F family protein [Candidatus Dormibacteria bacterium]